jgi:hypothetical protein
MLISCKGGGRADRIFIVGFSQKEEYNNKKRRKRNGRAAQVPFFLSRLLKLVNGKENGSRDVKIRVSVCVDP